MKIITSILFLSITLLACNPSQPQQVNDSVALDTAPADSLIITKDTVPANVPDLDGECFTYSKDGVHRFMHLWREGVVVHGELELKWDGKEGAKGTFEGQIINDTMWITHKFKSGEKVLRREIVYVRSGDRLYEGQGMQESKDGTLYTFKNRRMLQFDKEPAMSKSNCK